MLRIGIPRALNYYKYFSLWKTFFENLGAKVIFSPPTNRAILDQGAKYVVDEACLPVKVYFGHINYLKDKVDYIFAPRLVSVEKKEFSCPKFMGIPDMLVTNIDNLPEVIGPTIDLTKRDNNLWKIIWEVGNIFSKNPGKIAMSWFKGVSDFKKFNQVWLNKSIPREFKITHLDKDPGRLNIAVIGHEYILYDGYLSMNLLEKLAKLNVSVFTSEMIHPKMVNKEVSILPKRIFWNFAKNLLGSAFYFSKQAEISGFINISSFGCGPDAMTSSMIYHHLKTKNNKPILNLTIDEHTGEAGINTRIEAFYDLLKRRVG
ncbi:MAG: hypothetical protein PWQ67_1365 [Clostridia bacterium]|jgi:predicted nucleotide-binding protein (sugar kinase/HSP70/actin superfamily)|nr:hypothetical protein [Clostridia bacterium]MDN5322911.1 hypothetical protein [Clostridia bacterium]